MYIHMGARVYSPCVSCKFFIQYVLPFTICGYEEYVLRFGPSLYTMVSTEDVVCFETWAVSKQVG